MAPGGTGRDGSRRKRRGQPDCNSSWNARLKEIAAMLPISVPPNGRGLTKKETLVHMLQYLDFLESHIQTLQERLPPHCLPQPCGRGWGGVESNENTQSEPELESETPPCSLKTNRKHGCRRAPLSTEAYGEQEWRCPGEGGRCSDCEGQTGSENSSPSSRGAQDSPLIGSWALMLRDRMLDSPVPMGSPPRCNSLLPLLSTSSTAPSLNLSPSLLTSPARGLSHYLLPQGQELQALFEDVWVTPKSITPKLSSVPCDSPVAKVSEWEVDMGTGGGCVSSQSEGEDCTWTPNQRATPRRRGHGGRRRWVTRRKRQRSRPSLKKKCVNGFIMFCRINRKIYLRSHPGTPSTVVTKELAHLWHIMPKQERCVYCVKARRFSRQQNRNVRSVEEEGEEGVASPLHMLLAHRDLYASASRERY